MMLKILPLIFVAACATTTDYTPRASAPALAREATQFWSGEIRDGDGAMFAANLEPGAMVRFNSIGGDVYASLDMGRAMRRAGASARVERGDVCNSACVFVLLGARSVYIAPGARIEVHCPDICEIWLKDMIWNYVGDMGGDVALVDLIWSIPNASSQNLSKSERRRYLP